MPIDLKEAADFGSDLQAGMGGQFVTELSRRTLLPTLTEIGKPRGAEYIADLKPIRSLALLVNLERMGIRGAGLELNFRQSLHWHREAVLMDEKDEGGGVKVQGTFKKPYSALLFLLWRVMFNSALSP